jgi:hypothetical protein
MPRRERNREEGHLGCLEEREREGDREREEGRMREEAELWLRWSGERVG